MKALIDGDTPVFAAAICSQDKEEWVAYSRLDSSIQRIIEESGCSEYQIYVSGGVNFRYKVDPSYKANRPKEDPKHRQACKRYLIDHWNAIETDGYEADDAVGCEQTKDTIICGIDKDLLMIPGKHYQWPIIRKDKVIKEGKFWEVSEEEGMKRFFTQMLTGDRNDNIGTWFDETSKTWKKNPWLLSPAKAELALSICHSEETMYEVVKNMYIEVDREEDFNKNLDLLWIWRLYGETYNVRKEALF